MGPAFKEHLRPGVLYNANYAIKVRHEQSYHEPSLLFYWFVAGLGKRKGNRKSKSRSKSRNRNRNKSRSKSWSRRSEFIVCLIGLEIWTLRHKTNVYFNLAFNHGTIDDCFIMKSAVSDTELLVSWLLIRCLIYGQQSGSHHSSGIDSYNINNRRTT